MEENGITQFYSIIILFLCLWLGLLLPIGIKNATESNNKTYN